MTKRNMKEMIRARAAAIALATAAAAAALGGGGCASSDKHDEQVAESADLSEQNRMLVRFSLAENVYNGIAAERTVYSRDFDPGTAVLTQLGTRRIGTLAELSRNSTAPIVIVRGDAPDALYAQRVAAVRNELVADGMQVDEITLAQDVPAGGGTVSSDRALLAYQRLISDYLPKQQQGGESVAGGSVGNTPGTFSGDSNSSSSSSK